MTAAEVPIPLTVGGVILASVLLHRAVRVFGQPKVVGEIFAGLAVGVALNAFSGLFGDSSGLLAKSTATALDSIGSIGLVFIVLNALFQSSSQNGELQRSVNSRAVLTVTLANTVPSFVVGAWMAVKYAESRDLQATPAFVLLVGTSVTISAVPVLARILAELHLERSIAGKLAFRTACWTDVIGWVLVGMALSFQQQIDTWTFVGTRALVVLAIFSVLVAVRKLLTRTSTDGAMTNQILLILLLLSAGVMHAASLHLVFGAFLVGSVFSSHDGVRTAWLKSTAWITDGLFCPLFFAVAGMKLLSSGQIEPSELTWGAAFLALSIGIKLLPLAVAARYVGLSATEGVLLGLMLNTRGLMELVILSIGLAAGIFTQVQYSIFVVIAIVTTIMSAPLCRLAQARLNLQPA